jgi:hypothetical protein
MVNIMSQGDKRLSQLVQQSLVFQHGWFIGGIMAKIRQSTGYTSRNRSVLCLGKFLHHQVRICVHGT